MRSVTPERTHPGRTGHPGSTTQTAAAARAGRLARILVVAAVVLSAVVLLSPGRASAQSADAGDYIGRINALRTSQGLNALIVDGTTTQLASQHTAEMMNAHNLYHTGNLKAGAGSNWTKLGENVGYGSYTDIVWNAFLNSPSHYANLVDPAFTHIGVSVMVGPDGLQWTTHRFMAQGRPSAPANAPVTTESAPPRTTPPTTAAAAPKVTPAAVPAATPAPVPEPAAPAPAPADPQRVGAVLDALRGV